MLLQLASMRDKLVQCGVMQISSCIDLIQKKKQTVSRRRVMESAEFAAFMRGCQQLRNELFPRLAMLADALEEAFEFDASAPLAVVTKLSATVKDACAFLKEREYAVAATRIKALDLTPRTRKARIQALKAGTLNCLVLAQENADLLKGAEIQRCFLFDVDEFPGPYCCTPLNLFCRSEIPDQLKEMIAAGEFRVWSENKPSPDDPDPSEVPIARDTSSVGGGQSTETRSVDSGIATEPHEIQSQGNARAPRGARESGTGFRSLPCPEEIEMPGVLSQIEDGLVHEEGTSLSGGDAGGDRHTINKR